MNGNDMALGGGWRAAAMAAALAVAMASACGGDLTGGDAAGCVDHDDDAGYRVTLVTVWNGTPEFLPAEIGVADDCVAAVHTDDDSSYVHVTGTGEYTVGDFFAVWAEDPSERAGSAVENVSVNGQAYAGDYGDIVLEAGQRIVVAFGDRTP